MIEAKWFRSFWKRLWENSVFDSPIKKSLRVFVIAPELGSASPIMTHVFESAACCDCAHLEFCLPLLEQRGGTSDDASLLCITFKQFGRRNVPSFSLFLWHVP